MKKILPIIVCLCFALFPSTEVKAEGVPLEFKAYPVTEAFTGNTAPLILTSETTLFKSRLTEAAKQKPNFAGHYIVATWGCGAGCVLGYVIDAKTGTIYPIPHSVCCWPISAEDNNFRPVDYRADSNLMIFSGARNEKAGDVGKHYYKFENNAFVFLQTVKF